MLQGIGSLSQGWASTPCPGKPQQSPESLSVTQECPSHPCRAGTAPLPVLDSPILDKDSEGLWGSKGQGGIFRAISAPVFSFLQSLPAHSCTDTGAERLGADMAPVPRDFCTSAQSTAWHRLQQEKEHFQLSFPGAPPCPAAAGIHHSSPRVLHKPQHAWGSDW